MRIRQRRFPIFTAKIQQSFKFGALAMTHRQGFMLVYIVRANVLVLGRAGAPQSIKHINMRRIHEETNVTWWNGTGWSHCDDYAHSMTWVCTYSKCLKHIPMPQGQELSWLERVTHIVIRVHHTKCTITHTRAGIYIYIYIYIHIHTSCIMPSHRVGK